MPIEFQCTKCGRKLRAPDNAVGRSSQCPGCGSTVTCPEPGQNGVIEWTAENDYDKRVRRHRLVLAIACAVLVLAFVLRERPDGRVALRGLPGIPLPQACMSRTLLGLKCPGCGLTRSIIHLAEGDWQASWREHRLGGLMAVVIALQIPYRLLALRRPGRTLIGPSWQAVLGYALIALLLGNWLMELVSGRLNAT
jgi:DNA-directed RNA polymerase subunit RPC12/RpoP